MLLEFEERIGYRFRDRGLLETALTHSSYANESKTPIPNNERLEFLGDAVLSIVVSDYLFHRFHMAEGDLTKLRASIVCEKGLFQIASHIGLAQEIRLGRGEEHTGGRQRPSIVSDAMEAVIAAIYLDGGLDQARRFLLPHVEQFLTDPEEQPPFRDYKTILQEIVQQNPEEKLAYVLVGESGPDHCKQFSVEVHLNSNVIGRGTGSSKKNAEQMAAKEALQLMGEG
ncbi:MAG TPA: ribonuclease III [Firmicutes bacterium]|nr:ribonuclease III [Bacillota bacterium]